MSTKDLAALFRHAVNFFAERYLPGDPAIDLERKGEALLITVGDIRNVSALLTRLAEVDGEMETTEESRLGVFAECSLADAILRDIDRLRLKVAEQAGEIDVANAQVKRCGEASVRLHDAADAYLARADEAESRLAAAEKALREADAWLVACLGAVEQGVLPNWDGIREFRREIAALTSPETQND